MHCSLHYHGVGHHISSGRMSSRTTSCSSTTLVPYYIKADPKSNMAGLKFQDISYCFVKFGLQEELPGLNWQNLRPFH